MGGWAKRRVFACRSLSIGDGSSRGDGIIDCSDGSHKWNFVNRPVNNSVTIASGQHIRSVAGVEFSVERFINKDTDCSYDWAQAFDLG